MFVKIAITILEVAVVIVPLFLAVLFLFRSGASYEERYNNSKLKFAGFSKFQYALLFRIIGFICFIIAAFAFWNNYIAEDMPVDSENREFWEDVEKKSLDGFMIKGAMLLGAAIAIPARMGSSRFPGKPLAKLGGKEVLLRVYESCLKSERAEKVLILTDSPEIQRFAEGISAPCIMTSPECKSGTERIIEALGSIGAEFIVNVQGDEPFISPRLIDSIISAGVDSNSQLVTAASRITSADSLKNPNVVKVLRDNIGRAVYFSRTPLPYVRGVENCSDWLSKTSYWRHIGIYGYSAKSLVLYSSLPQPDMEACEMLEQLRFIAAGYPFDIVETEYEPVGIDTPADLEAAEDYIKKNSLA